MQSILDQLYQLELTTTDLKLMDYSKWVVRTYPFLFPNSCKVEVSQVGALFFDGTLIKPTGKLETFIEIRVVGQVKMLTVETVTVANTQYLRLTPPKPFESE